MVYPVPQERFASGLANHLSRSIENGHLPSASATADGLLAELRRGSHSTRNGRSTEEGLLDVSSPLRPR